MRSPNEWATAEEFSRHLLTNGHSQATVETYICAIRLFGAWSIRHEINPINASREAVQRYLAEELQRVGRNTVALRLAVLRAFYTFLDGDDRRTYGLRVKTEKLAPRLPFCAADVDALVGACRNGRDRAMVILAIRLGLRVGEIIRLQDRDIKLPEGLLLVRGKGAKQRWLPLSAELVQILSAFLGQGPLWRMKDGQPMTLKRAERNMEEIAKRAGVRAHWHRFRTTFGNRMIEAGLPIESLRILMGHESIATTEHYAAFTIHAQALNMMRRLDKGAES